MQLITGIEIRCDLPGPPICLVLCVGTATMNRNSLEDTKRQTVTFCMCVHPRSGHPGHLSTGIYSDIKVGCRLNCKVREMYRCQGAFAS